MRKVFQWIAAVLVCFSILTILPWTANETQAATDYSTIRVKMSIGSVSSHSFTINGTYVVGENPSIQLSAGSYTVKNANSKLTLYNSSNKALYSGSTVTIKRTTSSDSVYIRMPCKSSTYNYLGDMKYTRSGSKLNAINYIYLEDYLYGVVPHEMSNSWPLEALKVQAVLARTYAVNQMSPSSSYDVVDTPSDQTYYGYNANNDRAIQAVDETAKVVIESDGDFVDAYYSASNGGQTEIPQHVWSASNPLRTYHVIKSDPYDLANPSSVEEALTIPKTISSASSIKKDGTSVSKVYTFLQKQALPQVNKISNIDVDLYSDLTIKGVSAIQNSVKRTGDSKGATGQNHNVKIPCSNYTGVNMTMKVEVKANAYVSDVALVTVSSTKVYNESLTSVIGTFSKNTTFGVVQANAKSGYHKVIVGSQTGYVKSSAVSLNKAAIVSSGGNLYNNMTSSQKKIMTIPTGSAVTITDYNAGENWYKVSYNGTTGYLWKTHVDGKNAGKTVSNIKSTETVTVPINLLDFQSGGDCSVYTKSGMRLFTVEETSSSFEIYRRRYGHGIGMSQRGAQQMANQGKSYKDIINFYFPGVSYTTLNIKPPSLSNVIEVPAELLNNQVAGIGVINVSTSLNVRAGAGTSYDEIGQLYAGDEVLIIEDFNKHSDWYAIFFNSMLGYVHKDYVDATAAKDIKAQSMAVTIRGSNVYSMPSTKSTVFENISTGYGVEILRENVIGTWHLARYHGYVGFVGTANVSFDVSYAGKTYTGKVYKVSYANLYDSVYSDKKALLQIPNGTEITVTTDYSKDWYKVTYNGKTGYVGINNVYLKPTSPPTIKETATVLVAGAGFYSAPSSATGVRMELIPQGTQVQVVEANPGGWHKIYYKGYIGYVFSDHVPLNSQKAEGMVIVNTANVYDTTSSSKTIINTLTKGTEITFYKTSEDWYRGIFEGKTGYISADNVFIKPTSPPAIKETATVLVAGAGFYTEPSSSTGIRVELIPQNTQVQVVEANPGGWHKIYYKGYIGYVFSDHVPLDSQKAEGRVIVDQAKVYDSTSSSKTVVKQLDQWTEVTFYKTSADWYRGIFEGKTGYISADDVYLKAASKPGIEETGTVLVASVGLYSEPSSSTGVKIGLIPQNTQVEVIKANPGGWHQVYYEGYIGYVYSDHVPLNSQKADGVVIVNTANIYDTTTSSKKIVKTLAKGTAVSFYKTSEDWYRGIFEGKTGYISANDIGFKPSQKPEIEETATVLVAGAGFYNQPKSTATRMELIPQGTQVEVVKANPGGWHEIYYNGFIGYVYSDHVPLNSQKAEGMVIADTANIYDTTTSSKKIVKTLKKGTEVTFYKTSEDWYRGIFEGKTGYISADDVYLKASSKPKIEEMGTVLVASAGLYTQEGGGVRIALIPKDTQVEIVKANPGGYHKVYYKGYIGYVYSDHVPLNSQKAEGMVIVDTANIYDTTTSSKKIVKTLKKGTEVSFYKTSADWYRGIFEGKTGYISADNVFLKPTSPPAIKETATVLVAGAGFYTEPSSSTGIRVELIPQNTQVQVVEANPGGWHKIYYKGYIGYVYSDHVPLDSQKAEGMVIVDEANIYDTTTASKTVVKTLKKGTEVSFYKTSADWYRGIFEGKTGYISADDVLLKVSSKPEIQEMATVLVAGAGFYTEEGSGTRAFLIPKDTQVEVIEANPGGYHKVYYNGYIGYVYSDHVPLNSQKAEGKVIVETANIYDTTSTSKKIVQQVNKETEVSFYKTSADWYRGIFNGKTGYISADDVYLKASSKPEIQEMATVLVAGAGLYTEPSSTTGVRIALIPKDTQVEVVKANPGGWHQVYYEGYIGYVYADHLPLNSQKAEGVVIADTAKIYDTTTASQTIVKQLAKGTEVSLYKTSADWYRGIFEGKTGYISADDVYLKASSKPEIQEMATVLVASAGLYTEPSSATGVRIALIPKDTQVQVVEANPGGWHKVYYNGYIGYVFSDHLPLNSQKAEGIIIADPANVYDTTSDNKQVVKTLAKGTEVSFYKTSEDWYRGIFEGKTGYISADDVQIKTN